VVRRVCFVSRDVRFFLFYSNPSWLNNFALFHPAPNLSLPQKRVKEEKITIAPQKTTKKKTHKRGKNYFCGRTLTLAHAPKKNFCVLQSARVSFVICPSACLPLFRAFEHTKRTHRVSLSEKRERLYNFE